MGVGGASSLSGGSGGGGARERPAPPRPGLHSQQPVWPAHPGLDSEAAAFLRLNGHTIACVRSARAWGGRVGWSAA